MLRCQDLLLALCIALVAPGCGAIAQKKNEKSSSKAASTTIRSSGSSGKPKTRTANTPLAKEEGCYEAKDDDVCAMAKRIVAITNELRATQSLAPLKMHAGWSHVATVWAAGQADAAGISHNGFPDDRNAVYEEEFGTAEQPWLGAENVGRISIHSDDIEKVSSTIGNGWWESPGHHKNMVGDFTHLGVGLVKGEDGFYYATQIFAWPPEEEDVAQGQEGDDEESSEGDEAQVPVPG